VKAVRAHTFGGPDVLVYEDAPRPVPSPDQVLIRVHAAGVNPADWQVLARSSMERDFPWTPGFDVSGVIERAGANVSEFSAGDPVFGMVNFPRRAGSFAEYVTAPPDQVARKPDCLDHVSAGALAIVALTAWQSLLDAAGLLAGQRVLIHAAAGGVGHIAVQLATWKGAHVIGTASAGNEGFLRENGVDEFVDYRTSRFEDVVQEVDVVLDPFGGDVLHRSLAVLAEGGVVVSLKQKPLQEELAPRGIRGRYVLAKPSTADLARVATAAEDGHVRPHIHAVYPLREAGRALEASREGHARGKIVVEATDAAAQGVA